MKITFFFLGCTLVALICVCPAHPPLHYTVLVSDLFLVRDQLTYSSHGLEDDDDDEQETDLDMFEEED